MKAEINQWDNRNHLYMETARMNKWNSNKAKDTIILRVIFMENITKTLAIFDNKPYLDGTPGI